MRTLQRYAKSLHAEGIRVVLDGVFNHVGRGFWAFQDVLTESGGVHLIRTGSILNFRWRISNYNDGLWYEGWEGNYDLVKLNLRNEEVIRHYLFDCIRGWVSELLISTGCGWMWHIVWIMSLSGRLRSLLRRAESRTSSLVGETAAWGLQPVGRRMMPCCTPATNYECYKGLYSSFNSMNLFEINAFSDAPVRAGEHGRCIKGKHLLSLCG